MSKIITVDDAIADPFAPRIIRTPGYGGYAARFIAGHLNLPVGAQVAEWDSVAGSVPTKLQKLSSAAASTLTVGEENGIRHVHAPGDSPNGGRLLGPHTAQRPITIAAVVKAPYDTVQFLGATGITFTRNTTGTGHYQASSGTNNAFSQTQSGNGWVFLLVTQTSDESFIFRAGTEEVLKAPANVPPTSFGGLYFGPGAVGSQADVREMIYWPEYLNLEKRDAVHQYMISRYPDIA
ncbi:hypothetical protein [Arthrobacter sp. JSM 101049]|uniref:hypothetical protein n=1 Tax=Arthrobacter sp. JSM 101049 TaxID=929097 RepID=UPI00356A2EAA